MTTITRVTSADEIDGILAVEEASFTNPWTKDMYLAELSQPDRSFIYAARNTEGRTVAFCSLWKILDELHINNLAVEPSARNQGVASALLTRILSEGAQSGAQRATLEVRRSNVEAQRLYSAFGFTVTGVRKDYYTNPSEDALVLWRDQLEGFGS